MIYFIMLVASGFCFSFHPVLGWLSLFLFSWMCFRLWQAEERRIDGAMKAYAQMALKQRKDARRGVINI